MFTERILQTTKDPVVFAEQKMTVPTERLVRTLKISGLLGLNLVNLTYLGSPFVDPSPGDFSLRKPRILTANALFAPLLCSKKTRFIKDLATQEGEPLTQAYRDLSRARATDFRLSLEQVKWLLNPQEFDMTEFYLQAAGLIAPTRGPIASSYLPGYYEDLGQSGVPMIADYDRLADSSKSLIDQFGVKIIDLPDFDPELNCDTSRDFSQRSYIDLSMADVSRLNLSLRR